MALLSQNLVILTSLFLLLVSFATPSRYIKTTKYIPIMLPIIVLTGLLLSKDNFTSSLFMLAFSAETKAISIMFSLAMLTGSIYGLNRLSKIESAFSVLYYLSAIVVVATKSLYVLVITWEAMAIAAALLIFANKTEESFKAGLKYTAIHFASGCLLLIGVSGLYVFGIRDIQSTNMLNHVNIFILLSILINVALVPFSSWLIDGYSKASYSASIFLSAFTTKASVVVLFKFFNGLESLVIIGIIMSLFGAICACFIKDSRKMLGYGIITQVGIMVSLIGFGLYKAAIMLAFTHIIYKSLMFMVVGSLMEHKQTKDANLTNLSFNYKQNKILAFVLVFASLTSLAFPLTSTVAVKMFISSSLHHANHIYANTYYYFTALITALTVFNIGFKLPYFVFFNNKTSQEKVVVSKAMYIAMFIIVASSTLFTLLPFKLLGLVLSTKELAYYSYSKIVAYYVNQLMYIVPAVLVFYFTRNIFNPKNLNSFSSDFFYKLLHKAYLKIEKAIITFKEGLLGFMYRSVTCFANKVNTLTTNSSITNIEKTRTNSTLAAILIVFAILMVSIAISSFGPAIGFKM